MVEAGLDPTVINGGVLNSLQKYCTTRKRRVGRNWIRRDPTEVFLKLTSHIFNCDQRIDKEHLRLLWKILKS